MPCHRRTCSCGGNGVEMPRGSSVEDKHPSLDPELTEGGQLAENNCNVAEHLIFDVGIKSQLQFESGDSSHAHDKPIRRLQLAGMQLT